MNANALFIGSSFMMIAALAGVFLYNQFAMLKRKAVRVRIDNNEYTNGKPNNMR